MSRIFGNDSVGKGTAKIEMQPVSVPTQPTKPLQRASTASRNWTGPRTITVPRDHDGYGFTLRYFVVYPPSCAYNKEADDEDDDDDQENCWNDFETSEEEASEKKPEPLDTFFVKNVAPAGAAESAGLCEGDRIVSINGNLIGGKSYKDVVELIQSCDGNLKIGVVPRDEDILQLAYREYAHDDASLGYTAGLEQLAQDFDMQQPSVNKWATPIVGSRKTSSEEGSSENIKSKVSKYDPCVSFAAGAAVLKQDAKYSLFVNQSHGNSNSSSGKSSPGARASGGSTPPYKVTKRIDPCVTFIAGKPILTPPSEDEEKERTELSRGAVNPVTLKKALRQNFPDEANADDNSTKKGLVIIKQHFDKSALQMGADGAGDVGKAFTDANECTKKSSAISVLRDDFRVPVAKCEAPSVRKNVFSVEKPRDQTFHLSVSLTENDNTQPQTTVTYSRDLISRGQRSRVGGNLTSLTSQATLVESKSKSSFDRNQLARKGIRTHTSGMREMRRDSQTDERGHKIGFVVATKERQVQQHKISSSSDLSDDDSAVENKDVDGASADDELESYLLKGNRRVSYLMATATSPTTTLPHKLSDISNPEADDEDSDNLNTSHLLHRQYSQESVETDADDNMKLLPIAKEGWLNKKLVNSRRASSRTWKSLYTVLRGHYLYCYKEKVELDGSTNGEEQMQVINLTGSLVDIAHDYAKRKHVLRLTTVTGSEYLFQAPDTQSLMAWVNALRESNPEKDTNGNSYENVIVKRMKSYEGTDLNSGTSPPGTTKSNHGKRGLSLKRTHFTLGYKNTKKRGLVNIHISHGKDKEVQATGYTFCLPLEKCPPGKENEFVPIIMEHCCKVVEAKGLDYIGIYRVPGNAAAVQLLQDELDNKEPDSINFEEEKWNDLNNIGSLLKSFLRKLPEPLIPKEMYSKFIEANREEDSNDRLKGLRYLIRNLPDYHSQTLRHLVMHLRLIADHSEKNKMEPKNLAIVFGPTVVRTSDENMVSMVKDMSDQCRIIETLIHQADWIYAVDDTVECASEEVTKPETDGGKCYVASKGLLESLGQMAENFDGDQPPKNPASKDSKDKQGVASAIMSLTNFTSGISLKLRNKTMSPVFSKKVGKQDANMSPESENLNLQNQNEDGNSANLRRLASDPQILTHEAEQPSKAYYVSEGENDDEHIRVKSKIKSKYSRAVPLNSGQTISGNRNAPKQQKPDSRKNSVEGEYRPTRNNNGANITLQIPLRAEVTVRDFGKKDQVSESYSTGMLSEKTRLRLQQVSVEHQAASERRQIEKDKIDRERERTIRDLKQDDDELVVDGRFSPQVRDSDDSVSTTSESNSSSRKESLDSLSSPMSMRKYHISSRRITESVSSDEKAPAYKLTQAEIDQREHEKRQLDLFLGQFETSDEDSKSSPVLDKTPSPELSHSRGITTIENLGAKSLDEKLRILLDPNFQEKDGKLVRRNLSSSASTTSNTFPTNSLGYGQQANAKKADFAASIGRFDKPLKTKVIGMSAAKLNTPVYTPDMAARFDNFRLKKQELEKKVSSILQDTSKAKSIYDNESNKTDEQKVASLRQKTQMSKPQRLVSPTQRVIVSASDISQYPHRSVATHMPSLTYANPTRRNIETSLQRLDRNVQQVVELLHDSNTKELESENSELTALLNNLQRQASFENEGPGFRSQRYAPKVSAVNERDHPFQVKGKRSDVLNVPVNTTKHETSKPDLVRVQHWRTGSDQSKHDYGKFYPR